MNTVTSITSLHARRLLNLVKQEMAQAIEATLYTLHPSDGDGIYYGGIYYENQEILSFHELIELDKLLERCLKSGSIADYTIFTLSLTEFDTYIKPASPIPYIKLALTITKEGVFDGV